MLHDWYYKHHVILTYGCSTALQTLRSIQQEVEEMKARLNELSQQLEVSSKLSATLLGELTTKVADDVCCGGISKQLSTQMHQYRNVHGVGACPSQKR